MLQVQRVGPYCGKLPQLGMRPCAATARADGSDAGNDGDLFVAVRARGIARRGFTAAHLESRFGGSVEARKLGDPRVGSNRGTVHASTTDSAWRHDTRAALGLAGSTQLAGCTAGGTDRCAVQDAAASSARHRRVGTREIQLGLGRTATTDQGQPPW